MKYEKRGLFLWLLILLSSCSQPTEKQLFNISGQTMGTYYRLSLISAENLNVEQIQASIEQVLDQINAQMSTYRDDSEITQFNNSETDQWFRVSQDFAIVADKSKQLYQQSGGKFDATINPLVNLWSFGPDQRPIKIPSDSELNEVSKAVGSDKLSVRTNPPALKKDISGLRLDLSAIAKGFAVDKLAALLTTNGHGDFLVDIGGELRSVGNNPEGKAWRVGIEKPDPAQSESVQQIISISDKSIATSGSYRNYFEQGEVRFSHIIDPDSGYPIDHKLVSVSVITDDCMTADGYATALMVLGPNKGYDFALQYGLAVYMIEKKGNEFIVKTTPQMQPFME